MAAKRITFANKAQMLGYDPAKLNASEVNAVKDTLNDHADILDLLSAVTGKTLHELLLPQAVELGKWYITASGVWEAVRSFSAAAQPIPGANWKRIVAFTNFTASDAVQALDSTIADLRKPVFVGNGAAPIARYATVYEIMQNVFAGSVLFMTGNAEAFPAPAAGATDVRYFNSIDFRANGGSIYLASGTEIETYGTRIFDLNLYGNGKVLAPKPNYVVDPTYYKRCRLPNLTIEAGVTVILDDLLSLGAANSANPVNQVSGAGTLLLRGSTPDITNVAGSTVTITRESGASGSVGGTAAEPTPARVKELYESNLDTNAFTDAEQAALLALQSVSQAPVVAINANSNTVAAGYPTFPAALAGSQVFDGGALLRLQAVDAYLYDPAGTGGEITEVTTTGTLFVDMSNGRYLTLQDDWYVSDLRVSGRGVLRGNATTLAVRDLRFFRAEISDVEVLLTRFVVRSRLVLTDVAVRKLADGTEADRVAFVKDPSSGDACVVVLRGSTTIAAGLTFGAGIEVVDERPATVGGGGPGDLSNYYTKSESDDRYAPAGSSGGTGTGGGIDFANPTTLTQAATLEGNKAYYVTGGGYVLTLPSAAQNLGAAIFISIASNATGLYPIGGASSLSLYAGESINLRATPDGWKRTGGELLAMSARLETILSQQDQVPTNQLYTLPVTTVKNTSLPSLVSSATSEVIVQRNGRATINLFAALAGTTNSKTYVLILRRTTAGGSNSYPIQDAFATNDSGYIYKSLSYTGDFLAGDRLVAMLFDDAPGRLAGGSPGSECSLTFTEIV